MDRHKILRSTAVIGISLLLTSGLAACNPLGVLGEQAVEKAVKDATGADVDVDTGGGVSLPADFPGGIPLIDGKLYATTALPMGESKQWTITMTVDNHEAAYAEASKLLADAGYTETANVASADGGFATFDNGTWTVGVISAPASGSDGQTLTYSVMPSVTQ